MTIYTATEPERTLATEWHGGQASMLYAGIAPHGDTYFAVEVDAETPR